MVLIIEEKEIGTKPSVDVETHQQCFRLSFRNNEAIISAVRRIPGRRYSVHTVRNYSHHIQLFLDYVGAADCTDQDILGYITSISKREGVSTSYQNMAINAITFYVSTVLGRVMPKMNIRPKREKTLPVVLSEQEVKTLLKAVTNSKHRCI